MSTTSSPYGMRPIGVALGTPYSGGLVRAYQVTQENTYAFYTNGWCTMNAGKVDGPSSAAPVAIQNDIPSATQTPLGIVTGVRYTDPILKYTLFGQYAPAGLVAAGYLNVMVYVNTDPNQLYMIQADGAVEQAEIGLNMNMSVPAGSTTTGLSTITGSATTATTITYPLRVVDLVGQNSLFGGGLSVPGDTYTDCIVMWNFKTLSCQLATGV